MDLSAKELSQLYIILKTMMPEAPPDLRMDMDALINKIEAHFQAKYPEQYQLAKATVDATLAEIRQFYDQSHAIN